MYRFGRFEVHPSQRQLVVDGHIVTLGSRAFDLLLVLLEHPGKLLTKDALLDAVWPDTEVEENNLSVQISTLRKLLGADAVTTIPGRGYSLTAPERAAAAAALPLAAANESRHAMHSNLPDVLPPLIGRADDIAALGALMDTHRFVTITGAGGIGKTRLAEHLLHARRDAYPQGVAWVELGSLSDGSLMPGAMAGALGLPLAGRDPLPALVSALAALDMLIGLDNGEHLAEALAVVVPALLDGAPKLRLLVTSQMPLQLSQEQVYRLGPLAVPDEEIPLAELAGHGAVALFIERASSADRRFRADANSLPQVVKICSQLDGIPLAIELAAARVPTLGVVALAAALDERLNVLTRGQRGAPERQRTLRAALVWSHRLLDARQATVFRRLGVCTGGFSLAMARAVADDDERTDAWAVVDALCSLVDRSLVSADTDALPRYRMLDSARALALEQLDSAGEGVAVRRRHAQAVLQRFAGVYIAARNGEVRADAAFAALACDFDNARAVMAWALAADEPVIALTLAPMLRWALPIEFDAERCRLLDNTEPWVTDDLAPDVRAAWALSYAIHWCQRKPALATSWARAAVASCRETGDAVGLYRALAALAIALAFAMNGDECAAVCAELHAICDPAFPAATRLWGAQADVHLAWCRGEHQPMGVVLQRALTLARSAGDSRQVTQLQIYLAANDDDSGRFDEAVLNGLELERRLGPTRQRQSLAYVRVNLCASLLAQGSLPQARAIAQAAWPLAVEYGIQPALADSLARLAAAENRPEAAARTRGYADRAHAALGIGRQPNGLRAGERMVATLREQLGDAAYERLLAEGSTLRHDEVMRVALGDADPGRSEP